MRATNVGKAGLRGWRGSVADAVASPIAKRTAVNEDQIRAAVGAVFLLLTLFYLSGVIRDLLAEDE